MKLSLLMYLAVFILGLISPYFGGIISAGTERPLSLFSSASVNAPGSVINRQDIEVYGDKIIINIKNSSLGKYADTGSMLPVLNENSKGIRIVPGGEEEISEGDIVTYKKGADLIIHRVIKKGKDNEGVYFIVKGDNNNWEDGKIRFSQIVYKTVGVLY